MGRGLKEQQGALEYTSRERYIQFFSLLFVTIGILVRLVQYVSNRSLWGDEAALAMNIIDRSYLELLQPLEFDQAAPPGFLWIEKLAVSLLGNREYSLRLFPFLSSLIALLACYKLSDRYASSIAVPLALALFACLKFTVYYSTEVKQYSSDVMVALLLYLLLMPLRYQHFNFQQILRFGLLGAIAIWVSHPAVLILTSIEAVAFVTTSARRWRAMLVNRLPIYGFWLLNFGLIYVLTISKTAENTALMSYWQPTYPDFPFDVMWLFDSLGRFFYRPLGYQGVPEAVAMFAFVVGCVAYYRKNRLTLSILLAPTIVTLFASYLQKYPFRERLILFLVPFFILIIAEGIQFLLTHFRLQQFYSAPAIGIIVSVFLLVPPVARASQLIVYPERKAELRPVVEYVKAHQQPEERLYIHRSSDRAFPYYARKYGYQPNDYVTSVDLADIRQFRGSHRIWLVASDMKKGEDKAILAALNSVGTPVDVFQQPGAVAYLYTVKRSQ